MCRFPYLSVMSGWWRSVAALRLVQNAAAVTPAYKARPSKLTEVCLKRCRGNVFFYQPYLTGFCSCLSGTFLLNSLRQTITYHLIKIKCCRLKVLKRVLWAKENVKASFILAMVEIKSYCCSQSLDWLFKQMLSEITLQAILFLHIHHDPKKRQQSRIFFVSELQLDCLVFVIVVSIWLAYSY